MKKLTLFLLCAVMSATGLFAANEVTVSGSLGQDGTYNTLTAAGGAFAALNGANQSGKTITIAISASTTGEDGANTLTGAGGMWTSLTIYPTNDGVILTASLAKALINLNGAKYVTIDGRKRDVTGATILGSTPQLTIENSSTDKTTTGNAAFNAISYNKNGSRLASDNTITYCNIKGSSTNVVYINNNTGANTTATNNTISYNKFTPASTRPTNVINIVKGEHTDLITRNNFENVVGAYGIYQTNEMVNTEISYNSFYETVEFTPTVGPTYLNFSGNAGSATAITKNNTIKNNWIGGNAPECVGTMSKAIAANNFGFVGINLGQSVAYNTIKDNTIKNIRWNVDNSNSTNASSFTGIKITGANSAHFYNIIDGNFIGGITYWNNNSGTVNGTIIGIDKGVNTATYTPGYVQPTVISNNIISLGDDYPNTVRGIRESGLADYNTNVYNNTVYISGTPTAGSAASYCLTSLVNTNNRNFRNNIFVNTRSGGTGKHYGSYITVAGGTITSDYNNYYVTGTTGYAGYYGVDIAKTEKVVVTAQDANSSVASPGITPGSTPESFKGTVALTGARGTGITTDFTGATRRTASMGAFYMTNETLTTSDAPTAVSATAGDKTASVSFTAPLLDGGSLITLYTVTSNPGGITATGTESPISVTGLTNDVAYTFTVTATNGVGISVASAASTAVTPTVATDIDSNKMLQNSVQVVNKGILISKNVNAEVISISGKSVWKGMSNNQTIQLAKGVYIVKATLGQKVEITKVIVQ